MRLHNLKLCYSIMAFMIYSTISLAKCDQSKNRLQDEQKVPTPTEGVYTSILEIDKDTPKHAVDLDIRKYNSVDVYYIKKAKLRQLKKVLAISDGKDLYITIGNFRNKTGFVKTNYSNWHLDYKAPEYGANQNNTSAEMVAGFGSKR